MYRRNGIWTWKHTATVEKETGYEDVIDSFNIISVDKFKALTKEQQAPYVNEVIKKIRAVNIYPTYYYNDKGIEEELIKCFYAEVSPIEYGALNEHGRSGNTLLDFLFPNLHLAESGNNKGNSLYSRFYNDEKLAKCLHRHMKNYRFTNMRTPFFMYGRFFWSTPTNFSPMRAKAIYESLAPKYSVIYDFSAGYGGRMLGALSALKGVYTYIGCEPTKDTYHNLNILGQHIERVTQRRDSYKLYNTGSELLQLEPNSVDFAFSCPPYFALERYSLESTQSIVKYPAYEDWVNEYVIGTLTNVYSALKHGGKLGFIVATNVHYMNKKYALAQSWIDAAHKCGFTFVQRYELDTMSRKKNANTEALYIFRKGV